MGRRLKCLVRHRSISHHNISIMDILCRQVPQPTISQYVVYRFLRIKDVSQEGVLHPNGGRKFLRVAGSCSNGISISGYYITGVTSGSYNTVTVTYNGQTYKCIVRVK